MDFPLTVIIPTLDEAGALPHLLADLAAQRGVALSIVVADGGSADETREVFFAARERLGLDAAWVEAPRGRGAQLNAGARAAPGTLFLFLHADTRLTDPDLLQRAVAAITVNLMKSGGLAAGHFGLSFDAPVRDRFFYFYEAKTFTNRPHTVNGDQGLIISRSFFDAIGGFDESLPFMEDARIERRIRLVGDMVMLPGSVLTSARRFSAEGRGKRQVLNALVRVFEAAGRGDFLAAASGIYAGQGGAGRLRLLPFFRAARSYADGHRFWRAAGEYVLENAWQVSFASDCRKARKRGLTPEACGKRAGGEVAGFFDLVTDNFLGRALAGVLTKVAFYGFIFALRITEGRGDALEK